jgi:hypothetical protein
MGRGDEKLDDLEWYFSNRDGYIVKKNFYGPNVPSNGIVVEGPNFFRFSWCVSWPGAQVSCMLTYATVEMLSYLASVVNE